jgi:hypothetical protein
MENLKGNLVVDMCDIKINHSKIGGEGEDWIKLARKGSRGRVL